MRFLKSPLRTSIPLVFPVSNFYFFIRREWGTEQVLRFDQQGGMTMFLDKLILVETLSGMGSTGMQIGELMEILCSKAGVGRA